MTEEPVTADPPPGIGLSVPAGDPAAGPGPLGTGRAPAPGAGVEESADPPEKIVSLYNPANVLTAVRIVLVPVFLVLVVLSGMTSEHLRIAACVAFCVASATDFADGWIARRFSLVTSFGKVADPIADKALTGTALVLLSAYDRVSWVVTILILVREWGVTGLRFWVLRYGVIPASRGGKLKTGLQTAAIAWYLWPVPHPYDVVGPWLMGAALLVTMVTGADYVLQAVRMRRAG